MPKASDFEIEERIETIVGYILQGETRSFILRYCASIGVSDRQTDNYIKRAWERIHEANNHTRKERVSKHLKRLDEVAKMAIKKQNLFAALKAYELQAKIMGLEKAPEQQLPRIPETELPDNDLSKSLRQEVQVH